MTKFGDWARGPTLASVHSGSQVQQRIRDLANLAAQLEEALDGLSLTHEHVLRGDAREQVRGALAACKEFMEKYHD